MTHSTTLSWLAYVTAVLFTLAGCNHTAQVGEEARSATPENIGFPADVLAPAWLAERERAQIAAVGATKVRADFRFFDRRLESGISFRHSCLPDSAKDFRAVHYDHGNAVSVADVDGDGRSDLYFANQAGPNALWRNLGDGPASVTGTVESLRQAVPKAVCSLPTMVTVS